MRARLRRLSSAPSSSRALVVGVAAVALVSALWSAYDGLRRMDRTREVYAALEPAAREQEIELALRFDPAVWREIRRGVDEDDRFAVVSDAFEQHEVRNYANYALLPAVQVSAVEDATVVLYWASDPRPGSSCTRLAEYVCLERRAS